MNLENFDSLILMLVFITLLTQLIIESAVATGYDLRESKLKTKFKKRQTTKHFRQRPLIAVTIDARQASEDELINSIDSIMQNNYRKTNIIILSHQPRRYQKLLKSYSKKHPRRLIKQTKLPDHVREETIAPTNALIKALGTAELLVELRSGDSLHKEFITTLVRTYLTNNKPRRIVIRDQFIFEPTIQSLSDWHRRQIIFSNLKLGALLRQNLKIPTNNVSIVHKIIDLKSEKKSDILQSTAWAYSDEAIINRIAHNNPSGNYPVSIAENLAFQNRAARTSLNQPQDDKPKVSSKLLYAIFILHKQDKLIIATFGIIIASFMLSTMVFATVWAWAAIIAVGYTIYEPRVSISSKARRLFYLPLSYFFIPFSNLQNIRTRPHNN